MPPTAECRGFPAGPLRRHRDHVDSCSIIQEELLSKC